MSDTPRTDEEVWTPKKGQFPVVDADFAKELERECFRLAATACVAPWADERGHVHCGETARLVAALKEIIADSSCSAYIAQIAEAAIAKSEWK